MKTRRTGVCRVHVGFSLVELIIALTILAISLTGLAGAAAVAHRSFMSAEAIELGADAAATVLDSLMSVGSPLDGSRMVTDRVRTSWVVRNDSVAAHIDLTVRVSDGSRMHRLDFTATHHAR